MNQPKQGGFYGVSARKKLDRIARVILVGSGKGGVGKSFVACGLAHALSREGLRTGIFDIDLHGASIPNYLGLEPPLRSSKDGLLPKVVDGIRAMSVALLTGSNPVPIRGNDKEDLITQFFALTDWGDLDFLVVDLPPSTGEELFSAFRLFSGKASLILVTTPSRGAVNVVSRVRKLGVSEGVQLVGVVLNMAFVKKGKEKLFPFGRPDAQSIAHILDSKILVEIPLDPVVNSTGLLEVLRGRNDIASAFGSLAKMIRG